MDITGVIDRDSLEAYLEGLPDDVCDQTSRYVALRAATRVAPVASQFFAQNAPIGQKSVMALPVLGAVARSVVGLFSVASAATDAFAAIDAAVIWQAVRDDLMQTDFLLLRPLWTKGAMPQDLSDDWADARTAFVADKYDTDWRFWITWYERVLAGKDIHPDLLAPILTNVTKEDWLGDPAVVTVLFDDVLAVYDAEDAVKKTKNIARILDTKTAMIAHRKTLPATFAAILGLIMLEH